VDLKSGGSQYGRVIAVHVCWIAVTADG